MLTKAKIKEILSNRIEELSASNLPHFLLLNDIQKAAKRIVKAIQNNEKIVVAFDHNVPANTVKAAEMQKLALEFVKRFGIKKFHKGGEGICHQILAENYVLPNMFVAGGDSHTCTHGAFGAFATGFGATDMAYIYATGET